MSRYTLVSKCRRTAFYPAVALFDKARLYGPERIELQNMLLRQCNFPHELRPGDHVAEFWSNLVEKETWWSALSLLKEKALSGGFIIDEATDASFLAMSQRLVGKDFKVTGAIAVRFTNPDTDRPMVRLTAVGVYALCRSLFNDNEGPHVILPSGLPALAIAMERLPVAWADATTGERRKRLRPYSFIPPAEAPEWDPRLR